MPLNLKIQIGSALTGLFISIWWYFHEKKKVGPPIAALGLLALWMATWAFYFSFSDPSLSFLQALPRTLDINEFLFGKMRVIRPVDGMNEVNAGTLFMVVMTSIYALLFRWVWLMKNRKEANREW